MKNLLVLFPVFFAGRIGDPVAVGGALVGFFAFNALASSIYILNDLHDIEKDRRHPTKCQRPLASGAIKPRAAIRGMALLLALCLALSIFAARISGNWASLLYPLAYLVVNILYSRKLKNLPIIDVMLVASGFVIRLFYGGSVSAIEISDWLFLTVAAASIALGFGKRRNEVRRLGSGSRSVLDKYPLEFLTPIFYVFLTLTITFYSLWALQLDGASHIAKSSIVVAMAIFAEYARVIESDSDGDPAEVLRSSKPLKLLAVLFGLLLFCSLYLV